MTNVVTLPVYEYVQLLRATPDETYIQEIVLVYHKDTKRILKQSSPFKLKCERCGIEKDDRWVNLDLGIVLGKLMAAGWKENERGKAE